VTFARGLRVVALLAIGVASTGCEKSDVATTLSPDGASDGASSTVVARIDSAILQEASAESDPVGTVLEGDLLTVLAVKASSPRSTSALPVRPVGSIRISASGSRPARTGKAIRARPREVAQRIYQDKFLVQRTPDGRVRFPIGKVQVETAFSTITFQSQRGDPRPTFQRKDAEQLALYWLSRMPDLFPDWRTPSIYVRGFDGTVEYLMTMGQDKVPHFL
jgi:hypothetical protein